VLTMYGISNCDTVKKAKKWLDASGIAYAFHDYKKQGCPVSLVEEFTKHLTLEQLINKRGTTWRKLENPDKDTLDTASAMLLMSENPSLIKRPIVHFDKLWLIGFNESDYQVLTKN
jgi:arsenate reductase (glutaredoxin)